MWYNRNKPNGWAGANFRTKTYLPSLTFHKSWAISAFEMYFNFFLACWEWNMTLLLSCIWFCGENSSTVLQGVFGGLIISGLLQGGRQRDHLFRREGPAIQRSDSRWGQAQLQICSSPNLESVCRVLRTFLSSWEMLASVFWEYYCHLAYFCGVFLTIESELFAFWCRNLHQLCVWSQQSLSHMASRFGS